MKKLLTPLMIAPVLCCLLFLSGCKKDETGQFISAYNANETCALSGNFTYTMTITKSSVTENTVIISNFGGFGINVNATVSGNNLTIATQNFSIQGNSVSVSGSGAINGNILTIAYTLTTSQGSDNCTVTATKQ